MTARSPAPRFCSARAALLTVLVLSPGVAGAGRLASADQSELRRGLAMVGATASEEPAVREERAARVPSDAFMLGAALGAWINAAAGLRYDLETPSGDGDDSEAIAIDCYDERVAFEHLEARSLSLAVGPADVVADAGVTSPGVTEAWIKRKSGPAQRCR